MGLVLTIDFGNGERTIEIDGNKNITFLDYDIIHDLGAEEFGYRPTEESRFFKEYKEIGIEAFLRRRVWAEEIIEAVMEFGDELLEIGFSKPSIARMLYRLTLMNPDDEEEDYRDKIIELVGEDQLVDWLLDSISAKLEEKWSNIDDLTSLIQPYISKEDINVKEDIYYAESEAYENLKVGDYAVTIRENEIASWRLMTEYRIFDPIWFRGDVDSDFNEEGMEDKDSTMRSFLGNFDIQLKEMTDPEPPDHPESDANGNFAVLYRFSEEHSGEYEATVVPYKDIWNAGEAVELSGYIFDRDGEGDFVEMTILRKPTPEELEAKRLKEHEQEMLERQEALFESEEEPEEEREDWEDDWVPMTEEEVSATKKAEFKKKYGYSL